MTYLEESMRDLQPLLLEEEERDSPAGFSLLHQPMMNVSVELTMSLYGWYCLISVTQPQPHTHTTSRWVDDDDGGDDDDDDDDDVYFIT